VTVDVWVDICTLSFRSKSFRYFQKNINEFLISNNDYFILTFHSIFNGIYGRLKYKMEI